MEENKSPIIHIIGLKTKIIIVTMIIVFIIIIGAFSTILEPNIRLNSESSESTGLVETNLRYEGEFPIPVINCIGLSAKWGQPGKMWSKGYHTGLDFLAPEGSYIVSIADGIVYSSNYSKAYGNNVLIQHNINGETIYSLYAHMTNNSVRVRQGDIVKEGQRLGIIGATGNVTGRHLHLEIRKTAQFGSDVNPEKYFFN